MPSRRTVLISLSVLVGGAVSAEIGAALMGRVINAGGSVEVTPAMAALLADITDVIIPETDTPGAKAAGAHEFVIRVMRDCFPLAEQQAFYRGVEKVDETAQSLHGRHFQELQADQKIAIMSAIAAGDTSLLHRVWSKAMHRATFFRRLRELTITGYFISEIGATQALAYLPIPGHFDGDVPMVPGQKSWAIPA